MIMGLELFSSFASQDTPCLTQTHTHAHATMHKHTRTHAQNSCHARNVLSSKRGNNRQSTTNDRNAMTHGHSDALATSELHNCSDTLIHWRAPPQRCHMQKQWIITNSTVHAAQEGTGLVGFLFTQTFLCFSHACFCFFHAPIIIIGIIAHALLLSIRHERNSVGLSTPTCMCNNIRKRTALAVAQAFAWPFFFTMKPFRTSSCRLARPHPAIPALFKNVGPAV